MCAGWTKYEYLLFPETTLWCVVRDNLAHVRSFACFVDTAARRITLGSTINLLPFERYDRTKKREKYQFNLDVLIIFCAFLQVYLPLQFGGGGSPEVWSKWVPRSHRGYQVVFLFFCFSLFWESCGGILSINRKIKKMDIRPSLIA